LSALKKESRENGGRRSKKLAEAGEKREPRARVEEMVFEN